MKKKEDVLMSSPYMPTTISSLDIRMTKCINSNAPP